MIDDGTAEQTVDGMIPDDQSGSSTLSNSSRTTAEASWSGESSAGQGSPASDSRDGRSHERTQAGAKAQDQRITSGESADRRSGAHHEGTGRRNGSSEQQVQDPRTAQPTTQASPEGRQRPGANDADQKTIEETIGRRDGQQASAETGPDEDQSDSKSTGVLDSLRSLFS